MNDLYSKTQAISCKVEGATAEERNAQLPARAHSTDAGADLKSAVDVTIPPGERILVDTGVGVKIPYSCVGFVFSRSSQGKLGIRLANSVGVIDSAYRGNIGVLLENNSNTPYEISKGDRIAQLVIMPVMLTEFVDAWNDTERGTGGFGSTGKR